jgi:hypothetical protein
MSSFTEVQKFFSVSEHLIALNPSLSNDERDLVSNDRGATTRDGPDLEPLTAEAVHRSRARPHSYSEPDGLRDRQL